MPFGGARAEPLLAAGEELAGERDLRHEHQRLLALGQSRRDRLEIDFGLARAGDAVEQGDSEAVAGVVHELACRHRLLRVKRGALALKVERLGPGLRQRLGNEGAGIDQAVDHAHAHAGDLGEARFHEGKAIARGLDNAGAGGRHAGGRGPYRADAVAGRERREGRARAHHHAQHHAGGRQGVVGDPGGKVERHARQRRHVVEDFDDRAELGRVDWRCRRSLSPRPNHAKPRDGAKRYDDEPAGLWRRSFRHQIVVWCRKRERQQDGDRHRHGHRRFRLGRCLGCGQGSSSQMQIKGREGVLSHIVVRLRRLSSALVDHGVLA